MVILFNHKFYNEIEREEKDQVYEFEEKYFKHCSVADLSDYARTQPTQGWKYEALRFQNIYL